MEIIFYHQPYTHANGEIMHNKHDLNSIAQPFIFAPWMSQAFKDHIWIQLGWCYTVKQILYLVLMFGINWFIIKVVILFEIINNSLSKFNEVEIVNY